MGEEPHIVSEWSMSPDDYGISAFVRDADEWVPLGDYLKEMEARIIAAIKEAVSGG